MTKEELRHDSFSVAIARATSWVQQHFMAVIVGVAAIGIAVFAGVWMSQSNQRSQQEAGKLLHEATTAYASGLYSQSLLTLDDLLARHGGGEIGRDAVYLAGASHLALGEHDAAIERFRDYLDGAPRGSYAQSARMGLALALEGRGDHPEAAQTFSELVAALPLADPLHSQAAFGQARVLEGMGQFDAARGILEALLASGDFNVRSEAESHLAVLRAKAQP